LDGNQPTGLAKKSRHRRKRGPRIHAEEGMMGDQEGQAVLDVNASSLGLKFLHGQSENKAPLSLPTSGSHPLPLMLLPAPASTAEGGEHESKTLRQLQAEQDDEERFQADLERALQQSLSRKPLFVSDGILLSVIWMPLGRASCINIGPI
jgi:hypothetical protein